MLEAIRTSQDGMADEVSGNIVAELRKRGTFGSFCEERIQSVLELMWNKLEYALNNSQKMAGQLEECYDSKGMQSVLIGRSFKYYFGGDRFHMLPNSYEFSRGLCLNNFLQIWFISNKRDQVPQLSHINRDHEVSLLVRGIKLLGHMKYLMR